MSHRVVLALILATPTVFPVSPAHAAEAGEVLYEADWSSGSGGWSGAPGWQVLDGMLTYDGVGNAEALPETPFASSMPVTCGCWVKPPARLAVAPFQPITADYAIEAEMQVVSSEVNSSFGITARDGAVTVALNGGSYAVPFLGMEELPGQPFEPGTDWHTYRLEVQGSTARFLIDEALTLEFTGSGPASASDGHVGLYSQFHQINVRSFRIIALTASEIDYFALGDSIASGHGLVDDGTACRRSNRAYPYRVAAELRKRYQYVYFPLGLLQYGHHLACSGASALKPDNLENSGPGQYKWLHNQVNVVLEQLPEQPSDRPTLVTITIGANDFRWTDPGNFKQRLYQDTDDAYYSWVDTTVAEVTDAVRSEIKRLLEHPDVVVVLTEVHNPMNKESKFFRYGTGGSCGLDQIACYERVDYATLKLNLSYRSMVSDLVQTASSRVGIAYISDLFRGHEAPTPSCGSADSAPDFTDTWIQHADDPNSNSKPDLDDKIDGGEHWTGDCFHPNIFGAIAYANAVLKVFTTTQEASASSLLAASRATYLRFLPPSAAKPIPMSKPNNWGWSVSQIDATPNSLMSVLTTPLSTSPETSPVFQPMILEIIQPYTKPKARWKAAYISTNSPRKLPMGGIIWKTVTCC